MFFQGKYSDLILLFKGILKKHIIHGSLTACLGWSPDVLPGVVRPQPLILRHAPGSNVKQETGGVAVVWVMPGGETSENFGKQGEKKGWEVRMYHEFS